MSTILKESRKYGLHTRMCTQTIISGKEQESLRRTLLGNTRVKLLGMNGMATLKPLSLETGIPIKELENLKPHSFIYAASPHKPKLIKTHNIFGHKSPLLLPRGAVMSQTHTIVKNSGYYKPIQTNTIALDDRIDDIPINVRESMIQRSHPKPKFNS